MTDPRRSAPSPNHGAGARSAASGPSRGILPVCRGLLAWCTVREGRTALIVLLLALVARLPYNVLVGFDTGPRPSFGGQDVLDYQTLALSLAREGRFELEPGVPSAFRAPGLPLALAGLYRLFGEEPAAARWMQIFAGALSALVLLRLARALGFAPQGAFLAALAFALLPLNVIYCGSFLSEPLATLMLLCFALAGVHALGARNAGSQVFWAALAGLAMGAGTLVRSPGIFVLPIFAALVVVGSGRTYGHRARVALVFLAAAALCLAPWAVRNARVLDQPTLIASNGGSTFWGSNNAVVADPKSPDWGSWVPTGSLGDTKALEVSILPGEVERDRREFELGVAFLREHPGAWAPLLAGKLVRIFRPPQSENTGFRRLVFVSQTVLLPLALLGMIAARRRWTHRDRLAPVDAVLFAYLATTLIFYTSERFRAPVEPFLVLYALLWLSARFAPVRRA